MRKPRNFEVGLMIYDFEARSSLDETQCCHDGTSGKQVDVWALFITDVGLL